MTACVILDAGPIGLLTSPSRKKGETVACTEWLASLLAAGVRVMVPEIADYEVRMSS